jgi:hypothetical protein
LDGDGGVGIQGERDGDRVTSGGVADGGGDAEVIKRQDATAWRDRIAIGRAVELDRADGLAAVERDGARGGEEGGEIGGIAGELGDDRIAGPVGAGGPIAAGIDRPLGDQGGDAVYVEGDEARETGGVEAVGEAGLGIEDGVGVQRRDARAADCSGVLNQLVLAGVGRSVNIS